MMRTQILTEVLRALRKRAMPTGTNRLSMSARSFGFPASDSPYPTIRATSVRVMNTPLRKFFTPVPASGTVHTNSTVARERSLLFVATTFGSSQKIMTAFRYRSVSVETLPHGQYESGKVRKAHAGSAKQAKISWLRTTGFRCAQPFHSTEAPAKPAVRNAIRSGLSIENQFCGEISRLRVNAISARKAIFASGSRRDPASDV